jgi:hypothetical protein
MGPAATSDRLTAAIIDWVICIAASYALSMPGYLVTVRLLGLPRWACTGAVALTPIAC